MLGFGRNGLRKAKREAWADEAKRGKRIKEAQVTELKRRRAEIREKKAEAKRSSEIDRLRKRTELLRAQASEREAVTRRRRAREAAGMGRLFVPPKKIRVPKAVTRKRSRKAKIGWF